MKNLNKFLLAFTITLVFVSMIFTSYKTLVEKDFIILEEEETAI